MTVCAIVACDTEHGIGKNGGLPWPHNKEDMQWFKEHTTGGVVVMGRKTWESLPGVLPGRPHVVISRQPAYRAEGATVVTSLEAAIAACAGAERVFIIGGAQIYAAALALADVLWISEIDADVEGDAHFPAFDPAQFRETSRAHFAASATNQYAFDVVEYRRQR